jgi:hypothetical protein
MPLYTFVNDTKPGDAKGQGFKNVGTWRAVPASASSRSAPAATPTIAPSYGGGGGQRPLDIARSDDDAP